MEDVQYYESAGNHSVHLKYKPDAPYLSDGHDEPYTSSTIANMDKYDYMNLLAESRIVDLPHYMTPFL